MTPAPRLSRTHFSCPVEVSLAILGGKWKTVILAHLKEGPLRYGELRARRQRRRSASQSRQEPGQVGCEHFKVEECIMLATQKESAIRGGKGDAR